MEFIDDNEQRNHMVDYSECSDIKRSESIDWDLSVDVKERNGNVMNQTETTCTMNDQDRDSKRLWHVLLEILDCGTKFRDKESLARRPPGWTSFRSTSSVHQIEVINPMVQTVNQSTHSSHVLDDSGSHTTEQSIEDESEEHHTPHSTSACNRFRFIECGCIDWDHSIKYTKTTPKYALYHDRPLLNSSSSQGMHV